MVEAQKHKIRNASLQIDFEGLENGLGLQDSLSLYFHEKIEPVLQELFDEYSNHDSTLKIDKLDLDCGPINLQNWEYLLLDKLKEQAVMAMKSLKEKQLSQKMPSENAEEVFLFYLEKGYFPWNSPFSNLPELENEIEINESLISRLQEDSLLFEKVVRRLARSFSPDFLKKLTAHFLQYEKGWLKEMLAGGLEKQDFNFKIFRDLTECVLLSFTSNNTLDHNNYWINLISRMRGNQSLQEFALIGLLKDPAIQDSFKSCFSKESLEMGGRKNLHDFIKTALYLKPELGTMDWFSTLMEIIEGVGYPLDKAKEKTFYQKKPETDTEGYLNNIKKEPKPTSNETRLDEFIYVENGGMVLLHPFLMPLFENLGLIKDGVFKSSEMQNQAISILEYLVWGENRHSENYFPLNKILCGLDPSELWEAGNEMGQSTTDGCEEMLQEVIGHWKALKNTGIDGLREAFLQRNGKLSRGDKRWKLTIEQKPVDILLAKLPWGMGIIKLPWMQEMLIVEWA